MEIIKLNLNNGRDFSDKLVVTIGSFDGIHLGHKKIFEKMEEISNELRLKKAVITFDIHPDYLLKKRVNNGYISDYNSKLNYFKSLNFDYYFSLDKEILSLTYNEFHQKVLDLICTECIIVGEDFKYGYKALGNVETLSNCYKVISYPLVNIGNDKISSNQIRKFLLGGQVEKIKELTGNNYILSGVVTKGAGLGKKLGFPTANIALPIDSFNMRKGVYETIVHIDGYCYKGVTNVGINPTINTQVSPRVETYIIDFNNDIYGKNIDIEFIEFLREEKKFDSKEELIDEVLKNIEYVKRSS